jgi:electron transfer flavoprotein beta subunit
LHLPAVVSVDLRIVGATSVRSRFTDPKFRYSDGARFAPLPAIMAAKKKPLEVLALEPLRAAATLATVYRKFERPAQRKGGIKVKDVAELVQRLSNEAKVI